MTGIDTTVASYRTTLICKRCQQVYKVPAMAEKFGPWICYVEVAPGVRCWALNVWR
jgi:hypothetical protein